MVDEVGYSLSSAEIYHSGYIKATSRFIRVSSLIVRRKNEYFPWWKRHDRREQRADNSGRTSEAMADTTEQVDSKELINAGYHLDSRLEETYEILRLLGRGGMGAVYLAQHRLLGHRVAIKQINLEGRTSDLACHRFLNEAKAAQRIKHENVVTVHEFGLDSKGGPFAVMEYAHGQTLSELIAKCGPLDCQRTMNLLSQVSAGLQHAHEKGVVHRDVKPLNIIVSTNSDGTDRALVVDFGIAKIMEAEGQRLTQTGEIVGSPYYLSPEQALGQQVDHRSDIYSLGCVIFECIAGRPPFEGDNLVLTAMKHINTPIPELCAKDGKPLPKGLADVVNTCLEKDPAKRYQTAGEVGAALTAIRNGTPQRPSRPRPPQRWPYATAGMVLTFCLIATCIYFLGTPQSRLLPNSAAQLFRNPNSVKFVSTYTMSTLQKDMAEARELFDTRHFSDSAYRLLGSVEALKMEQKRLEQLRDRSTKRKERKELWDAMKDIEFFANENISHAGKSFLEDKQYSLAAQQLQQCMPYFRSLVTRLTKRYPPVDEAYQTYIAALEGLQDEKNIAEVKEEYRKVQTQLGSY